MSNYLIISLKNENKTQTRRYPLYEEVVASSDDACIKEHLDASIKEFVEEVQKIKMRIDIEVL